MSVPERNSRRLTYGAWCFLGVLGGGLAGGLTVLLMWWCA